MLEEIINELGDNYNSSDKSVLNEILEEVTANALTISNRSDKNFLKPEIKSCVKGIYLQRGAEGLNSLSERGTSSNFNDCMEKMRNDIIKNGKRVCY